MVGSVVGIAYDPFDGRGIGCWVLFEWDPFIIGSLVLDHMIDPFECWAADGWLVVAAIGDGIFGMGGGWYVGYVVDVVGDMISPYFYHSLSFNNDNNSSSSISSSSSPIFYFFFIPIFHSFNSDK